MDTQPENSQQLDCLSEALNRQRRTFSSMRTSNLSTYLERQKQKCVTPALVTLHGWGDVLSNKEHSSILLPYHLLHNNHDTITRSGGYWLRLGGLGIAINPGKDFLERFHTAGFHIWDIDHVIVTDGNESTSLDVDRIWTFNKKINTLLKEWNLTPHVISYWLHPRSFERYAPLMRPSCREEMACIQRLDTFPDISPFETVDISPKVSLDFCTTHHQIMLRIRSNEEQVSCGCLFQAPFEAFQKEFLSECSVLLLGMGTTSFEEISSLEPNNTALGYAGVFNITKAASARLAIISEQGFSDGDIRIEALKQLRKEVPALTILPAEIGATYYLDTLSMIGPGLETATPVDAVRSMRSHGPFSRLTFLDEGSIL